MNSPYVEKILSFEPEPENYSLLEKNIKLNNCSNIIPINKAVSTITGKEKFYVSRASSNRHTLETLKFTYPKKILEINCIGINDIFKEYEFNYPCLLKMDIEGGEYKIIPSLTQENLNKIKIFILEAHEYPDKPNWSHTLIENLLISWNYKTTTKKLSSTKLYCGWAIRGIK
jgi:FkbM family methyltransferase